MSAEVDVLIAGAGPVGLTLAAELERMAVNVRIADGAAGRTVFSRATDLHARSLELWDHTGVADAVMAVALPITSVPLFSGGREVARLDFTTVDSRYPAAVSLPQQDLEQLLSAHLTASVEWSAAVGVVAADDDGVAACVGNDEVRASFLVACDGVHSHLRDAMQIPFDGEEFAGRWAAMDVTIDGWPYGAGELPVFLDGDGFWAMPLPGGRVRLFFRDDHADPAPTLADGQAILDRHVPGGARIVEAEHMAGFELHHRVARSFRAGRVLLAGDAAHVMTPVSGQGLNTGVQDAYNLAWKLRLALDGAPASLIDSYDAERRPVAIATVAASTTTHDANVLTGDAAETRDRTLAAALATPAEVLAAVTAGHELDVAYADSPIVSTAIPGSMGVVPGQRVPDAGPLVRPDGSVTSLHELMRHPGLQLWACVGTDPPDPAIDLLAPFTGKVKVLVIAIADRPPPARAGVDALADPSLRVHGRLGAVHDTVYVARPDGYLGARIEPPNASLLNDHLRWFGLSLST